MPVDLQSELWRGLVSALLLMLMALVGYVVSVLHRMKGEQDARAAENQRRDVQRAEIQENVRRLTDGHGVALTEPPIASTATVATIGDNMPIVDAELWSKQRQSERDARTDGDLDANHI
jgi:uncharacterized iron-regulated membrane protein